MRILGIIPARGGSKGIPGKNIKLLLGKPLIHYTIEQSEKSAIDTLVLSTDTPSIQIIAKQVAKRTNCEDLRPVKLAEDKTPMIDVVKYEVQRFYDKKEFAFDAVMILQPTAPLRQTFHINTAIDTFINSGADSLISVSVVPEKYNPEWLFTRNDSGYLKVCNNRKIRNRMTRRQDFPESYMTNGAIYLFKIDLLFDKKPSMYGDKVFPYLMDEKYNCSIDIPSDWPIAEEKIKDLMFQVTK